jgi:hypothetical protein
MIITAGCFIKNSVSTEEPAKEITVQKEEKAYTGEFMNGNFYYLQTTDVKVEELPNDCDRPIIYYINTSWLKHRKNNYHLKNDFSQGLSGRRECFIGMKLSFLEKLLGKPDKEEEGKWIYQLCNNEVNKCSDEDIAEHIKERMKVPSDIHNTFSYWLRQDVIFSYQDSIIISVK